MRIFHHIKRGKEGTATSLSTCPLVEWLRFDGTGGRRKEASQQQTGRVSSRQTPGLSIYYRLGNLSKTGRCGVVWCGVVGQAEVGFEPKQIQRNKTKTLTDVATGRVN